MELHPSLHYGVVAIEKGSLGSPSTKVANFTLLVLIDSIILKWMRSLVMVMFIIVSLNDELLYYLFILHNKYLLST